MAKKTPFQKQVIRNICSILKNTPKALLNLTAYYDTMIEPMVRHYPEVTRTNSFVYKNINSYQTFFKWTERADYEFRHFTPKTKDDSIYDHIKMEHIYPSNNIVNALLNLPPNFTIRNIIEIFNYSENVFGLNINYEIIIVSQQEMKFLDSGKGKTCPLIDVNTGITSMYVTPGKKMLSNSICYRMITANIKLHPFYINNTF